MKNVVLLFICFVAICGCRSTGIVVDDYRERYYSDSTLWAKENAHCRDVIDSLSNVVSVNDSVYRELSVEKSVERVNDTVYITQTIHDIERRVYVESERVGERVLVADSTSIADVKEKVEKKNDVSAVTKTITKEREVVPWWWFVLTTVFSIVFLVLGFFLGKKVSNFIFW